MMLSDESLDATSYSLTSPGKVTHKRQKITIYPTEMVKLGKTLIFMLHKFLMFFRDQNVQLTSKLISNKIAETYIMVKLDSVYEGKQ